MFHRSLQARTRIQLHGIVVCAIVGAVIFAPSYGAAQDAPLDPASNKAELRTWKDSAGRFSVEARLIEVQAGKVHLEKADGETIIVPLAKLCLADQRYAQEPVRQWKATTGHTCEARLLSVEGNQVRLKKVDGVEISLALSSLSEDDQKYVASGLSLSATAEKSNLQPAIPARPWQIVSCRKSNLAQTSNGAFVLSSAEFVTVVLDYPELLRDDPGLPLDYPGGLLHTPGTRSRSTLSKFQLRAGKTGPVIGKLIHVKVNDNLTQITLKFEAVSAGSKDIYLLDGKRNKALLIEKGEDNAAVPNPRP